MAQIMELFSAELADFVKAYEKEYWRVDFHGEKYPPRIVWSAWSRRFSRRERMRRRAGAA